jgi:hypothetical protein
MTPAGVVDIDVDVAIEVNVAIDVEFPRDDASCPAPFRLRPRTR